MKMPPVLRDLQSGLQAFDKKRKQLLRTEEALGKKLQPLFDKHKRSISSEAESECYSIANYLKETGHFAARFFFQRVLEIQERRAKQGKKAKAKRK